MSDLDAAGQNAEIIARRYPIWNLKASLVFAAAIAIATIVPVSMALAGIGIPSQPSLGFFSGQESIIQDPAGDAEPVLQSTNASVIPEVKGYHDVTAASIREADGHYTLTINLSGNPNDNEKYETNYMWHLISTGSAGVNERYYVIMFFNFAPDFNHTAQGWHYAVFDRTHNEYVLPQTKIGDMPTDRVEFNLDADLVGNPQSLWYWVSVYTRVDSTSFEGEPEYLMDYAP